MFPLKYDITLLEITDSHQRNFLKTSLFHHKITDGEPSLMLFHQEKISLTISTQLDVHLGKMMLFYTNDNKCYTIKTKSSFHNCEDNNVCFLLVLISTVNSFVCYTRIRLQQ
jgi:hypothetical protein